MRRPRTSWVAFGLFQASLALTGLPNPTEIWQVKPPINSSDALYAGWSQIPVIKEIEVQNGVAESRTYSHHPELFSIGDTAYLIFSSAPVDEDSMGQDVWISVSEDGGLNWTPSRSLIPAALLSNQTDPRNFTYWCERGIAQRAWQALTFVHLPTEDELYAIGQSASIVCPGNFQAAGRIAQRIDFDGLPLGDPCWIDKNNWTETQLFAQTVYGTAYGMKTCQKAAEINAVLLEPDKVPAWSSWLYNHKLYAADNRHDMQEQTHAVWFSDDDSPSGGYWQRFWRDISAQNNSLSVWIEYNANKTGKGWYPNVLSQWGNQIYETNIPDAKTKQYLGAIAPSLSRYLISNPRYDPNLDRQPLTIATSRGDDPSYRNVGVLRTNASTIIAPETRDQYKNHGFSYPTAVQVGNKLIVAYSENKENIWVSVLDIDQLP